MEGNKLKIEDFWGEKVTSIAIEYDGYYKSGMNEVIEIDKLSFHFGDKNIVITPVIDTDEIDINLIKNKLISKENSLKKNLLSQYIGKQLTFTWECINNRGYFDVYMLAFTDLNPKILVLSEGSTLKLLETKFLRG